MSDLNLGLGPSKQSLSKVSVVFHNLVIQESERYFQEQKIRIYITPTSFIDFIRLYMQMLKTHSNILPLQIRKYTIGLQTLKETNTEVAKL